MRGLRITPRDLENITIDTTDIKLDIGILDKGTIILKIHAQDPHKHETDTEIYTWNDDIMKIGNTETIYIIPKEIKDD